MSQDLTQVACLQSDDPVKRDLELTCTACGKVLCDVQHEDTLGVLVSVAQDHACGGPS